MANKLSLNNIPPAKVSSGIPPVIVVSGSNYEMGYQYGRQAAPWIFRNVVSGRYMAHSGHQAEYNLLLHLIHPDIPMPPSPSGPVRTPEQIQRDMKVLMYYTDNLVPSFGEWHEGIVAGCAKEGYEISRGDLILITGLLYRMISPLEPYPEECGIPGGPKASEQSGTRNDRPEEPHMCNSYAAAGKSTTDGKPVVAINGGGGTERNAPRLILIAFPEKGNSYISFPFAGRIIDQAAINSSGFSWLMTANMSRKATWGLIAECAWQYLGQHCSSPAEAHDFLKAAQRTGMAGNFLMSDAAGNISLVESNAEHFVIRKPGDAGEEAEFLVNANHFAGTNTRDFNIPDWQTMSRNTLRRYATLWQHISAAAAQGKIDFAFTKKTFKSDDWYDPDANQWHYNDPGSGAGLDNFNYIMNIIMYPASLTMHFSYGNPSGIGIPGKSTGEYIKLQLGKDPDEVTTKADQAAFLYYIEARNLFKQLLNTNPAYLTYPVVHSFKERLDEVLLDYGIGVDRAAFAYEMSSQSSGQSQEFVREQMVLWSESLSHFGKAQLEAQMITDDLKSLSEGTTFFSR